MREKYFDYIDFSGFLRQPLDGDYQISVTLVTLCPAAIELIGHRHCVCHNKSIHHR